MILFLIIVFSLLGNVGTVVLASLLMSAVRGKALGRWVTILTSYATGTLLGAAFLGMLPRALGTLTPSRGLALTLAGVLAFYVLERFLVWRHCHDPECHSHAATGPLILFGDAFHNFCDGVVIAACFVESTSFGITMSLAVIAHEVPQELGDIAILLKHGYPPVRAFVYNALSGAAALIGALLGYFFLSSAFAAVPFILAVSASSFIYIALADLIPEHRGRTGLMEWITDLVLTGCGVGTIMLLRIGGG